MVHMRFDPAYHRVEADGVGRQTEPGLLHLSKVADRPAGFGFSLAVADIGILTQGIMRQFLCPVGAPLDPEIACQRDESSAAGRMPTPFTLSASSVTSMSVTPSSRHA